MSGPSTACRCCAVSASVSPDATVTGYSVTRPSGNAIFDAKVRATMDAIVGQQEIAIKSLDRLLRSIRGFSGATILGDGRIALILDTASLVEDLKERRFQADHVL